MTIPAIAPSERDDFDERELEDDDAWAVDVFVAGSVGDVEIEEVVEVGVGLDDIEAEAEAASSFVNIWMLS
jgi:hypothetical protein